MNVGVELGMGVLKRDKEAWFNLWRQQLRDREVGERG